MQTKYISKYDKTATYLFYGSKTKSLIGNWLFTFMTNSSRLPISLIVILELERAIYKIVWDSDPAMRNEDTLE